MGVFAELDFEIEVLKFLDFRVYFLLFQSGEGVFEGF